MPKYTYKVVQANNDSKGLTGQLNKMASEGWRCVHFGLDRKGSWMLFFETVEG